MNRADDRLKAKDVAAMTGLSPESVKYHITRTKKLPAIREETLAGPIWVIKRADAEAFAKALLPPGTHIRVAAYTRKVS